MEKNPRRLELIGKQIKVIGSSNSHNMGIDGKVIDETKNTIEIKTKKEERKKLIKKNITIEFKMDGKTIALNGSELIAAPEERIKLR